MGDTPVVEDLNCGSGISMVNLGKSRESTAVSNNGQILDGVHHYTGSEPPFKHITRTLDVRKSTWDKFMGASLGRKNSGVFTSVLQPPDDVACESKKYWKGSSSRLEVSSAGVQDTVQRSVFGWPMISPYSMVAFVWSVFMLFIDATYTAFLVPIVIAFMESKDNGEGSWVLSLDILIGAIFLVDIVLNFSFGFIVIHNYQKKVVMNKRSASWYYLRHGDAWIDFLSILPFLFELRILAVGQERNSNCSELCFMDRGLTALRLARLLRLKRFLQVLFTKCAAGSDLPIVGKISPATFYFANVMYTLAVMVNFLGCLLYGIARWEGLENSWIAESGHLGDSDLRMYLTSIYWATVTVTTVGYGEMTPVTALETVAVLIILIFALVGFGMLIGSAGEVLGAGNEASRRAERLRNKMVDVDGWIKSRKLSRANERKIHAYYTEVWSRHPEYDESSLLDELPVELRSDVVFQVVDKTLDRLEVFEHMDDSLQRIVASRLIPHTIPPGHNICRQGDTKEAMYILQEGVIEGYVGDIMVQRFQGPTTIGEDAVLGLDEGGTSVEPMTLLSAAPCKLWELPLKDLETILLVAPHVKEVVLSSCQAITLKQLRNTSAARSSPFRSTSAISEKLAGTLDALNSALEHRKASTTSGRNNVDQSTPSDKDLSPGRKKWNIVKKKTRTGELKRKDKYASSTSLDSLPEDGESVFLPPQLMALMKHLLHCGNHGLVAFVQEIQNRMELASKSGSIVWEFKKLLAVTGLEDATVHSLYGKYINGGVVLWRQLIDDLQKQPISSERWSVINSTFSKLVQKMYQSGENNSNDSIPLQHLIGFMNPSMHPDVRTGLKDEFGVTLEMLESFRGEKSVKFNNFLCYLSMVSTCIVKEEDFVKYCTELWVI